MAEIRGSGTWSSALSADEFAAIRSVGFEPVGQVLGAAVYNVGYTGGDSCPGSGAGGMGSYNALVQTMYEARHKAIDRMSAECAALGGHGVVSASIEIGRFPGGGLEIKAIGTAVRAPGGGQLP